jgi:propanol-preferring alcohol dehydrogenase
MTAMALVPGGGHLVEAVRRLPEPGPRDIVVHVLACGVCRTDLHVVDGDLKRPKRGVIPGHEIVGRVVAMGSDVRGFAIGDRVGIPWLGATCGRCPYCREGRENLCDRPTFTGYTADGGYAEYAMADAAYCFPIPSRYADAEAAPLLCAGLIGYRAWKHAGAAHRLGLYGFGAAAHLVAQMARHAGQEVYAFTRKGDRGAQELARSLGAAWAGASGSDPPKPLDAAIIFAPVGALVPEALRAVRKGGTVVLGGIHMSEIPAMPYEILWGERVVRSIANLTRRDGTELMELAPRIPLKTHVTTFPLGEANAALDRLRSGKLTGAAVLIP